MRIPNGTWDLDGRRAAYFRQQQRIGSRAVLVRDLSVNKVRTCTLDVELLGPQRRGVADEVGGTRGSR